jgi:hypothetical protein
MFPIQFRAFDKHSENQPKHTKEWPYLIPSEYELGLNWGAFLLNCFRSINSVALVITSGFHACFMCLIKQLMHDSSVFCTSLVSEPIVCRYSVLMPLQQYAPPRSKQPCCIYIRHPTELTYSVCAVAVCLLLVSIAKTLEDQQLRKFATLTPSDEL